jgi:hypothetical protein
MSCGIKGSFYEYYKFHRADTISGCERSCAMLNSTKTDKKGPHAMEKLTGRMTRVRIWI